nr:heavy metal-associated isoprenylated plant protein 41-like [Populus alba]
MVAKYMYFMHYLSKHRMLLVGEDDFSLSLSLARPFRSALNLVSTTVDTQGTLFFLSLLQLVKGLNKILLRGYLSNAKVKLKKDKGEIHVTHKGDNGV